jgi:hypothetical protein
MASKSTLYATVFPDDKLVLLSKEKIAVNCAPLRFEKESAGCFAKGISVLNLQDKLAVNIPVGHRLVIQEITFEDYNEKPVAILNFQEHLLVLEESNSAPVDFHVKTFKGDCTGNSHLKYLLSDDADENE